VAGSNHITGTAEPKVIKFCTQAGYINPSNRQAITLATGWHIAHKKGVVMVMSRPFWHDSCVSVKFCRDAASHAVLSATAELLVIIQALCHWCSDTINYITQWHSYSNLFGHAQYIVQACVIYSYPPHYRAYLLSVMAIYCLMWCRLGNGYVSWWSSNGLFLSHIV